MVQTFDAYEYNQKLKQLYKIHDGNGYFNIDKLEDLIREMLEEKFEIEIKLQRCQDELFEIEGY